MRLLARRRGCRHRTRTQHLPLYRQADAFARLGVALSRKTLCDWVQKAAFCLEPVAAFIGKEVKRRTRVIGLFPNEDSVLRLATALLMEISEDWESGRVYLSMGSRP